MLPENIEIEVAKTDLPYITFWENKNPIGFLQLEDDYLTFDIDVKSTNASSRGTFIFTSLYDKFLTLNVAFKGIRGYWTHLSDNNKQLNEAMLKLPLHEACFETWTGKRAKSKGFTRAKVISLSAYDEAPPEYAPIHVIFYK